MSRMRELRGHLRSSAELSVQGRDSGELQRLCKSGKLVRVRHGIYTERALWKELDLWDRYRLLILAVNQTAINPPLFSHESAAVVLDVPILGIPALVHTQQEGGQVARSRNDIRRHFSSGYVPKKIRLDGLRLTGLNSTLVALGTESSFVSGVVAVDAMLHRNRTDTAAIGDAAGWIGSGAMRQRLNKVLEFSDARSESPGESASRAYMHLFGFPPPQLQAEFRDAQGFIARTDFYWPELGLIGEFDGLVKYQKPEYMKGQTASQVVVAEKKREDRLRARDRRVIRWLWEDINEPHRLRDLLLGEGLTMGNPLRRSHPMPGIAPDIGRSA